MNKQSSKRIRKTAQKYRVKIGQIVVQNFAKEDFGE